MSPISDLIVFFFFKSLYRYELSNGQIFSEAGTLKEVGDEEKVNVIVVSGQYSFVGQDGQTYWVNYTADENGFHPVVGKLFKIISFIKIEIMFIYNF